MKKCTKRVFTSTVTVHEKEYGMTFTYYVTLSGNNLTMQISGGKVRTFSK